MYIETINGIDVHFEALPEYLDLSDTFDDSVTDLNQLADDINSGRLEYFCAKVTGIKNGIELASDYLGACCYKSSEDFVKKYHDDYFIDMANTVVKESINAIHNLNN